MKEQLKDLALASGVALAEGLSEIVGGGSLDSAYAKMIESLSDSRLAKKNFPDGHYVPPTE